MSRRVHAGRKAVVAGIVCIPLILAVTVAPIMKSDGVTATQRANLAGRLSAPAACSTCHGAQSGINDSTHFLYSRADLSQQAWADTLDLVVKCGACHEVPDPGQLPANRWPETIKYMYQVQHYLSPVPAHERYSDWLRTRQKEYLDVLHYYVTFSGSYAELPPDPVFSPPSFQPQTIGAQARADAPPRTGNVNIVDLDQNGYPDVLATDFNRGMVTWLHREDDTWKEEAILRVPFPGRAEAVDVNKDGHLDVAVAVLGTDIPSDKKEGGVVLLMNDGTMHFSGLTPLIGTGRASDVRPGDFDGDGDIDFVVSIFGWMKEGEIGWLEQQPEGRFTYRRISDKRGGVHVIPADLNRDGALDFVALIAQEHEEITAFMNGGQGRFEPRVLFKASTPTFGSSGIELVDLDEDDDLDILYTNGDAVDLTSSMVRPYHGVQWLENRGNLQFTYHELLRMYGAYRAVPGDLDNDGDLDIVATSFLNDWADTTRMSLVWLENDGSQRFQAHGIANAPTHLITADLGDLNEDGLLDIVTGSMHFEPPYDRLGRVTLWLNSAPHPPHVPALR